MFQSKFNILTLFTVVLLLHVMAGILFSNYSSRWIPVILVLYLLMAFGGYYFTRWNFYVKSKNKCDKLSLAFDKKGFALTQNLKTVVLTFERVSEEQIQQILPILKREKIPAIFFVTQNQIKEEDSLLKKINNEGHDIGIQGKSYTSIPFFIKKDIITEELENTNRFLEKSIGKKTRFYRPPYGHTCPGLARALRSMELTSVGRSIKVTKFKKVTALKSRDIILFSGTSAFDLETLKHLIKEGKERKFRFGGI